MEKTITFKQESFVFANSLNEYIINKNKEKMSHFSDDKNTYSLHHGRSMGNSNEILDSELTKHSVEVTYDINDVLEYKIETMYSFIDEISSKMSDQMKQTIYKVLNQTCEKTGNVVNAKESKKSNPELFLEMLEKIELSVNEKGEVVLPDIHLSPGMGKKFIAELEAEGEELHKKVEKLKQKKAIEAIQKEQIRLARYKGISNE